MLLKRTLLNDSERERARACMCVCDGCGGTSGKPFTARLHPLQNAILRVMIQVFVQNGTEDRGEKEPVKMENRKWQEAEGKATCREKTSGGN